MSSAGTYSDENRVFIMNLMILQFSSIFKGYKLQILTINSKPITKKLLKSIIVKKTLILRVKRRYETIDLELVLMNTSHYPKFSISRMEKRSDRNKMLFDKWLDI